VFRPLGLIRADSSTRKTASCCRVDVELILVQLFREVVVVEKLLKVTDTAVRCEICAY